MAACVALGFKPKKYKTHLQEAMETEEKTIEEQESAIIEAVKPSDS